MLTPSQHAERRKHLGSTDVIRILDGHARDVYMSKVYEVEQGPDTPASDLGHRLEPVLLDWFEEGSKFSLIGRGIPVNIPGTPIATTLDAIVNASCGYCPVNAKTSGLAWEAVASQFGDPQDGNKALPERVIAQTHIEMECVAKHYGIVCDVAYVPVLLPRRLFVLYEVHDEPGLRQHLTTLCDTFWESYVQPMREPGPEWADVTGHDLLAPSLDILKRIRREPGSVIDVPQEPASTWLWMLEGWKLSKKEAETQVDELKSRLTSLLGDAEAGRLPDGQLLTYLPTNVKGFTVQPRVQRTLKLRERT